MNETRFIELLNLYVDQQLSPQEAAELEAEIQANPGRRRTYEQYCRMQKACAQIFEHERSAAPASDALLRAMADADRKIVAFPSQSSRRSVWPVGLSLGAVAAAACVAFVLVRPSGGPGAGQAGGSVATVERPPAQPTEPAAQALVANAAALASKDEFKPVFVVQPLRSTPAKSEGLFVAVPTKDNGLLDWTRDVQFEPMRKVSADDLAFGQRPAAEKPVTMKFSPATEEPATEINAIQFTR